MAKKKTKIKIELRDIIHKEPDYRTPEIYTELYVNDVLLASVWCVYVPEYAEVGVRYSDIKDLPKRTRNAMMGALSKLWEVLPVRKIKFVKI
ncbi:MAG: hypothetical protein Q6363_005720 [Candidatus Njordarchaeota archaeon]